MKRGMYVVAILFVFSISLISAGIFSDIFKTSGKASSAEQNVSVTVQGTNAPTISYVEDINGGAAVMPWEGSTVNVIFQVRVSDADGVSNIDDSSVQTQFTRGSTTRSGSCVWQNDVDATTANYTCTVTMNYYDEAGDWNVEVTAQDQEANSAADSSEIFTYSELKAFSTPLAPSSLSWPSLTPGASNQLSNNDPTTVTNTGNYRGNIIITGYNLVGESNSAENIPSTAFSVASTSGSECTGTALQSDGTVTDTGIYASPGPTGSNNAYIYYCLTSVPIVSSQTYSTSARGQSWVISY